jgi:protein SCO1/2
MVLPAGAGVALLRLRAAQGAPEVYGTLPPFRFTSQAAQPFGAAELKGRVWVANFIFTRCPTVCPRFTAQMAHVQERTAVFGPALQLVSFTVDPSHDTPEKLEAYARRYKADPARWTFLTGDYQQLKGTIVDGFKVAMGREEGAAEGDLAAIFHGEYFVLVDAEGRVRGYYDFKDAAALDALLRDAERLVHAAS